MILYHGSNVKIEEIDLEKSKPFKDFGKGFYLSDTYSQAKEMADFKVAILGGEALVTEFEFNDDLYTSKELSIKLFETYSDEWLDFIIANRGGGDVERYDFVYGPIADDKVGVQLRKYKDRNISKEELLKRLKFIKGVTFQYFFGSLEALRFLKRL